ncbi:MAG TPA: DnaJ domain-containing protein [Verrucomicrobiae bacterium]|nr:DnaJ domain-containing protein [Verrucomicrobiae bacterium]
MTDNFLLLAEPRRPWLDADMLKEKFFKLSASTHPDRIHQSTDAEKHSANERYTQLNAAYNCLREPKDRLRHLLELERGTAPKDLRQPPNDLVNLSFEVGQMCRIADALIAEAAKATSPLIKVQFFGQAHDQIEKLTTLRQTISKKNEAILVELKSVDAAWIKNPLDRPSLLPHVEVIAAQLGFFARWLPQLQERQLRLTF